MSKESEAIKAEALAGDGDTESTETPAAVTFDFEGHAYSFDKSEPSPKSMEHLAEYVINDSGFHALLFVRQVIGQEQWDQWCERHESGDVVAMLGAINEAFPGN